jgi:hypothetical protein
MQAPTTVTPRRAALALAVAGAAAAGVAVAASASSTPVGPLPPGPTATYSVQAGERVSFALPRHKASTGLVWRLARFVDDDVAAQIGEGDIGKSTVVVYKARSAGKVTIRFALTKGDSSPDARASRTFVVKVREAQAAGG